MVLVTVCKNNTLNSVGILFNISEIGDYKVNTEHISVRKCHSAVNNNYIVLTFNKGDVLADFIKTAEKCNFYRRLPSFLFRITL